MAVGLIALLDDVAAIAKVAAASLDDVAGAGGQGRRQGGRRRHRRRRRDAALRGRLRRRARAADRRQDRASARCGTSCSILLPAALVLSLFAPWAITPLLMIGGAYLCYEGAEKVFEALVPHAGARARGGDRRRSALDAQALEDEKVASAIKTDFILSAEIMAIALAAIPGRLVLDPGGRAGRGRHRHHRAVYGVVALIVKADDAGVALARNAAAPRSAAGRGLGRGLVLGMPVLPPDAQRRRHRGDDLGRRRHHRARSGGVRPRRPRARHPRRRRSPPATRSRRWPGGRMARHAPPAPASSASLLGARADPARAACRRTVVEDCSRRARGLSRLIDLCPHPEEARAASRLEGCRAHWSTLFKTPVASRLLRVTSSKYISPLSLGQHSSSVISWQTLPSSSRKKHHGPTRRKRRSAAARRPRAEMARRAHDAARRGDRRGDRAHYGRDELLRRLAHPFWFQSFGAVMGMDWHSSGITTSVIGALKRGLDAAGGRARHPCLRRARQAFAPDARTSWSRSASASASTARRWRRPAGWSPRSTAPPCRTASSSICTASSSPTTANGWSCSRA